MAVSLRRNIQKHAYSNILKTSGFLCFNIQFVVEPSSLFHRSVQNLTLFATQPAVFGHNSK